MADVFISYAKTDRLYAKRLAAALTAEGWDVWWDPEIEPGEDFDEVIDAELEAAQCVVVLWSHQSCNSRYVKGEARDAMEQLKLVPAFIDEKVKPPRDFRSIQSALLQGWDGDRDNAEYQKLTRRVTRLVEKTSSEVETEEKDYPQEAMPSSACRIYISYRREDSLLHTHQIYDILSDHFDQNSVWKGVDYSPEGGNYLKQIETTISQCGVLLVVIGREWIEGRDEAGNRRLDSPADPVRIEIESALYHKIPLVPVLVRGAAMPREEQLPDSLKELWSCQAYLINDEYVQYDVKRLMELLKKIL